MYTEDELLMLSGIQHISFCKRQWALIHVEKQWVENVRTIEGQILHEKVDDSEFTEKRKGLIVSRAMPIVSYTLGLYGIADVVEFISTEKGENSTTLAKHKGFWHINLVEYKRGKAKNTDCDKVQLCAQAICLEEMFNVKIETGNLYYGETRHRLEVVFDEELRNQTFELAKLMHYLFKKGITPKAEIQKGCKMCSLVDICMPKMPKSSAEKYFKTAIYGDN
ncbi:MAG: CRISPR-associated protein Cas4 [Candidatus Gastranaerophilales bacterium]|nr:CRISPR-associated protein Cas4 [Candidatus Gastranaerophilales bacterium]